MKKIVAGLTCLFGVMMCSYFVLPVQGVGTITDISSVYCGSQNITEELDSFVLLLLEQELSNVERKMWKNPVDVYPLNKDTIIIECEDESQRHRFIFVGSQSRFSVDTYNIYNGEELYNTIKNIMEDS